MSDEDWDWELTDRAKRELEALDDYAQERIVSEQTGAYLAVISVPHKAR